MLKQYFQSKCHREGKTRSLMKNACRNVIYNRKNSMSELTNTSPPSQVIGTKLAPFNPSHDDIIEIAYDLMQIGPEDVLYDLGCGDGRVLLKACQLYPSITAVGIEYDGALFDKAQKLIAEHNCSQITIIHDNVLNIDFDRATAIFVYLLPEGMRQLREKFLKCIESGSRIVSYVFSIPELEPTKVILYKSATKIYLYQQQQKG